MVVPVFFFFAVLSAKQDQTALRSGCDATAQTIANLPSGTSVDIRFRLSDGSDCFKVSTILDGKLVMGYVTASVLSGLEQFEEGRASAASADTIRELRPMEAASQKLIVHSGDLSLERAAQLLASNQPAQALELLEPAVKRHRNDPNVLLLTGLAAYRSDQLRAAIDYWKQSLDLAPNETLARVYERVRREAAADQSGERLLGMHIALRYEGEALPSDTARAILSTLDEDYARISAQLGCSSDERIIAIVQSRDAYLRGTGAAEWSGGEYDGRIDNARLAYNLALAAADALYENYSSYGIRNVINNPESLRQVTAELDKKLGL